MFTYLSIIIVRPLTEGETKTLFSKLANYIGSNLVHLVDTPDDVRTSSILSPFSSSSYYLTTLMNAQPHVFRLHRSRVYYVRESLMRQAISVPRANLISLGVCLGKFSKTEKFRLHVTGLDLLGRYAKNKVSLNSFFFLPCSSQGSV